MSERVSGASAWMDANDVDTEAAELIQSALGTPGDWGSFEVRRQGTGKVIIGPVSRLLLPDEAAELAFQLDLQDRIDDDAASGRPEGTKRQPR